MNEQAFFDIFLSAPKTVRYWSRQTASWLLDYNRNAIRALKENPGVSGLRSFSEPAQRSCTWALIANILPFTLHH